MVLANRGAMQKSPMLCLIVFAGGCTLYFDGPTDDQGNDPSADLAEREARCAAPEGPAIGIDPTRVPTELAGRWWYCAGAAEFYGPVEFTLDQKFYMLTEVDGDFERNLGPTKSGTYSIVSTPPGVTFQVNQHWIIGDSVAHPLMGYIEEMPRKLFLGGGFFVPLD